MLGNFDPMTAACLRTAKAARRHWRNVHQSVHRYFSACSRLSAITNIVIGWSQPGGAQAQAHRGGPSDETQSLRLLRRQVRDGFTQPVGPSLLLAALSPDLSVRQMAIRALDRLAVAGD